MICYRRALSFAVTFIVLSAIITIAAHTQNTDTSTSVVAANTRFAFKLFHALTTKSSDRNMLVAPTGMSLTFALLDNVADAGARKEIEDAFEFTGLSIDQMNEGFSALHESLQIASPKMTKRPDWMTAEEWRIFRAAPQTAR
jgi:serine protease inhibitor